MLFAYGFVATCLLMTTVTQSGVRRIVRQSPHPGIGVK